MSVVRFIRCLNLLALGELKHPPLWSRLEQSYHRYSLSPESYWLCSSPDFFSRSKCVYMQWNFSPRRMNRNYFAFPDFISTIRLTFIVVSVMSWQLVEGLPWNLVQAHSHNLWWALLTFPLTPSLSQNFRLLSALVCISVTVWFHLQSALQPHKATNVALNSSLPLSLLDGKQRCLKKNTVLMGVSWRYWSEDKTCFGHRYMSLNAYLMPKPWTSISNNTKCGFSTLTNSFNLHFDDLMVNHQTVFILWWCYLAGMCASHLLF